MIRRASIPGARPPPDRRRPGRAARPRRRARGLPRPGEPPPRLDRPRAIRTGRAPGRYARRRRPATNAANTGTSATSSMPVLIERLDPAQVVQPLGREAGLLRELPPRRVGRRLARLRCAVHGLPRARAPAAGGSAQHEALERRGRRPAARTDRPATRGPRSRAPPGEGVEQLDPAPLRLLRMELRADHVARPTIVGNSRSYVAGGEHGVVGQRRGVVAVHVVEELWRAVEHRAEHRVPRPAGGGLHPGPSRRAAPAARSRTGRPRPAAGRARAPRAPPRWSRRRVAGRGRCPSPAGPAPRPRAPRRRARWSPGSATPGRSCPTPGIST